MEPWRWMRVPLSEDNRRDIAYLIELRDSLRQELVEAGQVVT